MGVATVTRLERLEAAVGGDRSDCLTCCMVFWGADLGRPLPPSCPTCGRILTAAAFTIDLARPRDDGSPADAQ
jgi:hypothetical protein